MPNDLIVCADVDSTLLHAVEAARHKLHIERCAIFIERDGNLWGTYGTDHEGYTTDEHANSFANDGLWLERLNEVTPQDAQWIILQDNILRKWDGKQNVPIGKGWTAVTPIATSDGFKGLFFNDTAITGKPLDPVQQELVSVFCSLLGRIIERKQIEENVRQALEKEKELGELKSRFIGIISHEFRTPLTVIQSSSQLLKYYSERLDETKKRKQLDTIEHQLHEMTVLVDNVLTLNRAESVGLDFKPTPTDVIGVCRSIVEEIRLTSGETHPIVFTPVGTNSTYMLDERLVRRIVTNLLTNAVKYSPLHKSIHFEVKCELKTLIIRVQDQGIGIPEDDQKHLFESFHRAKNVGSISGTGLGLSIVKEAVQAHGGTITVSSREGLGTTFTVTLPNKQAAEKVPAPI
jgi:signal transduction histidine kinase